MPHPTKAGAFFDLNDAQITETRINPDEFFRQEKAAAEQVRAVFRAGPSTHKIADPDEEPDSYRGPTQSVWRFGSTQWIATRFERIGDAFVAETVMDLVTLPAHAFRTLFAEVTSGRPAMLRGPGLERDVVARAVSYTRHEIDGRGQRFSVRFEIVQTEDERDGLLDIAAAEELDRIAARYGVRRLAFDTDNMLRDQIRMVRALAKQSTPISLDARLADVRARARAQQELRARGLGIEPEPGESTEELRERIEAALSGDTLAADPKTWQAEKERRAKRTKAARDIALATGQSTADAEDMIRRFEQAPPFPSSSPDEKERVFGMHRIGRPIGTWSNLAEAAPLTMAQIVEARDKLRQASQIRGVPRAPTPAEVRVENLRIGAELAKSPPAWAYPLGWTLAVSAAVELANNRPNPSTIGSESSSWLASMLRRYHGDRLDGTTAADAQTTQYSLIFPQWGTEERARVCEAYERGRGAPGGKRLGRPA